MSFLKRVAPFLIISLLYGCAGKKLPDMVWPLPPDPPKVRFVKSFAGAGEFKGLSVTDILLGAQPAGNSFVKPHGVHVDQHDRIFVTDTGGGLVIILDPTTKKTSMLGASGRTMFTKPISVTSDKDGNAYITDTSKDMVFVFDGNGQFVTAFGRENEFKQPTGLAVDDKKGILYVTDTHKHQIFVLNNKTGEIIRTIGKRGKADGEFNFPAYITLDKKGNLYVVDIMNGRVQVFDPEGRFLRTWGRLGDGPGQFARPKAIAIDSEDNIYVVEEAFKNVNMLNDVGQVLKALVEYIDLSVHQILPAGIAIDSEDRIYVVDQWNARVNVYEFMGEKYKARKGKK